MNNPIKQIYKFNKEAGFLDKPMDGYKESAYQIEEALEGYEPSLGGLSAKNFSRKMMAAAREAMGDNVIPDVDELDKAVDGIVFNFGKIFKMGLTPQQADRALSIVMSFNMQKLTAGTDSEGKQQKPEGFEGPEIELQKLLDKRGES